MKTVVDEDDLPPSASQARPLKRGEKISPRKGTKASESKAVETLETTRPKQGVKRQLKTAEKSPKKATKEVAEVSEKNMPKYFNKL